ncbi:MAG: hypothetical protein NDI61_07575 [Bdellovibrionaceae bacterium]|nr:hypothetical protein [Pseudobdellovibrionaceae bacterium]
MNDMGSTLGTRLYSWFYTWFFTWFYCGLLSPLLIGGFRLAALGNEKIRTGLQLRTRDSAGKPPWARGPKGTRPIWIHCASGEFEYAKPVISELKRRDPDQKILVSYFSPSVRTAIEKFPGVDTSTPAPWDRPDSIAELIAHHEPRALLIARTDTWPAMLAEARRQKIPSLLFSATLVESSGRLHPLVRPFTRRMLRELSAIFCVSESDKASFSNLGLGEWTTVAGDTRFDQVLARLRAPKPVATLFSSHSTHPSNAPRILVAGSTWEEDEAELVPAMAHMKGRMKFIVAPHEPSPNHLLALETRLRAAGLSYIRYSEIAKDDSSPSGNSSLQSPPKTSAQASAQSSTAEANSDVVVIDRVGILAELYLLADFAFVGGSFRKTVHSVMEPLGAGCLTFVGPLHQNNREALEFATVNLPTLSGWTAVTPVASSVAWRERLKNALASDNAAVTQSKEFIRREIEARSGRSGLVADWVLQHRRA